MAGRPADGPQKAPEHGPEGGDGLSPVARQMRAAQPWIGAVWKLMGGCAVGVIGGLWMDRRLGTGPWGLLGLSLVGISVGFYAFIRAALRLGKASTPGER